MAASSHQSIVNHSPALLFGPPPIDTLAHNKYKQKYSPLSIHGCTFIWSLHKSAKQKQTFMTGLKWNDKSKYFEGNEKNCLINVGSQNIYSNLFSNISKKIGTHHFLVHQQFSSYISFCFCKCLLGNCIFILFSYIYIAIYNPGQHLDSANI